MNAESSVPSDLETKNGYYYGTTKGRSWWRRYTKDGWLARGNSEIWVDEKGFRFRRYMMKEIKEIPCDRIVQVETGRWHAGKFTGAPVIKVIWNIGEIEVVSGFSIAMDKKKTDHWIEGIKAICKIDPN